MKMISAYCISDAIIQNELIMYSACNKKYTVLLLGTNNLNVKENIFLLKRIKRTIKRAFLHQ